MKKNDFEKRLSGARGQKNVLTWVKTRLKYLCYLEIESLPWTAQSGQYFPKITGGGVFTFFWTPVTQKQYEISKCAKEVKYCKFKDV